ncbi:MAG TPA: hypothetical protein PLA27_02610 [Anaerolineales bacterium]|jgi:hypothetical protein|nr:hypothetical protein [Anaerolineales bacterium]HQX15286.1 hypothetical protein [Anaerolineales bacterium]
MNIFSLFRRKPPPAPLTPAPDSSTEPPIQTILRALVIVYDPVVDKASGKKLSEHMRWNKVEDLAVGFMSDILQASGGLVRYQITQRIDVDSFPAKVDGYSYDANTYLNVQRGATPPYMPQEADYLAIIKQFDILKRVARNEIDEVWIFNFPDAGFYESIMGGPGAFWCNAPPLQHTEDSKRRFVIMGFSSERGQGEMLENMGHRAESIMEKVFENLEGDENYWKRFIRYDRVHKGQAALGNVHFAPNSVSDYDWNNPSIVVSECDDWLYNFPNFKGITRQVSAADWGNGDTRKHHLWWMSHFPKTLGRRNGISHNWWQYIADPNHVIT